MVRHLITAGVPCMIGFAAVAVTASRYGTRKSLVRFAIATAAMIGLISIISASSTTTEKRCTTDPAEICVYNDGVPMIAVVTVVFVLVCAVRSWLLYSER